MSTCCAPKAGDPGRYDLAVIGAGSAGFSAAITAAEQGAQVALIGAGTIGGTCVNIGCVPSKALIRAVETLHNARAAARFAGVAAHAEIGDWCATVRQKDDLVASLRQAKYSDLLPAYNTITYREGAARLVAGGVQIAGALPIYLFVLPREPTLPAHAPPIPDSAAPEPRAKFLVRPGLLILLAASITLASMISTVMSVHLLTILQAKGFTLTAAVGLGALVGPSQVAARTIEMLIARYHHPIWTKLAATTLVTAGLGTLWDGGAVVTAALLLYGAGIGLESIARGTLPLALFGPERYPAIMGRIAMPSLMAQAAAPSIGAVLLARAGLSDALAIILAAAAFNVLLVAGLFVMTRARPMRTTEIA